MSKFDDYADNIDVHIDVANVWGGNIINNPRVFSYSNCRGVSREVYLARDEDMFWESING